MARKIKWSADALDQYKRIFFYLSSEWGETVSDNFVDKVNKRIEAIVVNPEIGKIAKRDKNARSIVITLHNKLYYEVRNESIEILAIFDTRQNPSKNRFE